MLGYLLLATAPTDWEPTVYQPIIITAAAAPEPELPELVAIHDTDGTDCDDPETVLGDPDNLCGHGCRRVWVEA